MSLRRLVVVGAALAAVATAADLILAMVLRRALEVRSSSPWEGFCAHLQGPRCRLRLSVARPKHSLPDDWWADDVGPAEQPGAHWELGWDDELASFYARLLMDYEPGELGELGEGLDPEGEVEAFFYGGRPGQYIEVEQLQGAMADEINWEKLLEDSPIRSTVPLASTSALSGRRSWYLMDDDPELITRTGASEFSLTSPPGPGRP